MPREAKLFSSSAGSAVRVFLKFRKESASRASCHKRCAQGTESSVTTLGGGVQQGEFLSRNTHSFGAATEWVVEAVETLDLNAESAGNGIAKSRVIPARGKEPSIGSCVVGSRVFPEVWV